MCSPTFLNLKESKKETITHAALDEFSKNKFDEASVTDIVNKAGISRGSFYQYFGSKDKLYKYLVNYLYSKHRSDLYESFQRHSGQLYPSLISFYDLYIDELIQSPYFSFYKNTFLYVNHYLTGEDGIFSLSDQTPERKKQQEQFTKAIDMESLKTDSEKELLEYVYFIVNTTHHMIIDGFVNDLSAEEVKEKCYRVVGWLYYGIEKDE